MSQAVRLHSLRPVALDASAPDPPSFLVHLDGTVGEQHIWRGHPTRLVGFQPRFDALGITLDVTEFLFDVEAAVGLYPVFADPDDMAHSWLLPVASATWVDAPEGER